MRDKQRQRSQARWNSALEKIEDALKALKQSTAGEPERRAAVEDFDRAFQKLKERLVGQTGNKPAIVRGRIILERGAGAAGALVSNGRVLEVDLDNKQVLLSSGSKDGVEKGQLFRVYQNSMMPDQTGCVRITQVGPKWSVGKIVQEFSPRAPMRPSDIIQLHDGKPPKGLEEHPGEP